MPGVPRHPLPATHAVVADRAASAAPRHPAGDGAGPVLAVAERRADSSAAVPPPPGDADEEEEADAEVASGGRDAEEEDAEPPLWRQVIPRAAALSVAYVAAGTAVYMRLEGWGPLDATFFATQAVLCVGYSGVPLTSAASELFTTGYVLWGNVLASGAVALYVQASLSPEPPPAADKVGANRAVVANGVDGGAASSGGTPEEPPPAVQAVDRRGVALLLTDLLTIAVRLRALVPPPPGGAPAPDPSALTGSSDARELRRALAAFLSDLATSAVGRVLVSYSLLWTWIAVGTAFFAAHDGLPPTTALLASVASLTTLGLISPRPDDGGHIFVLAYLLTGVAIYAASLGRVADVFRVEFEAEQARAATRRERARIQVRVRDRVRAVVRAEARSRSRAAAAAAAGRPAATTAATPADAAVSSALPHYDAATPLSSSPTAPLASATVAPPAGTRHTRRRAAASTRGRGGAAGGPAAHAAATLGVPPGAAAASAAAAAPAAAAAAAGERGRGAPPGWAAHLERQLLARGVRREALVAMRADFDRRAHGGGGDTAPDGRDGGVGGGGG